MHHRFGQVRELAQKFLFEFEGQIRNLPGSTAARESVVATGMKYLDSLAKEAGNDAGLQLEIAQGYQRLGDVQGYPTEANLGRSKDALRSYEKAIALEEAVWKDRPKEAEAAAIFVRGLSRTAIVELVLQMTEQAERHAKRAVNIADELSLRSSADIEGVRAAANAHYSLAMILADTNSGAAYENMLQSYEALRQYNTRKPSPDGEYELAATLSRLPPLLLKLGRVEEALMKSEETLQQFEKVYASAPQNYKVQRNIATQMHVLGRTYWTANPAPNLGDPVKSARYHERSLAIPRRLLEADPDNAEIRKDVGNNTALWGEAVVQTDPAKGLLLLQQSQRLLEQLPETYALKPALIARTISNIGEALVKLGRHGEAIRQLEIALTIYKQNQDSIFKPEEYLARRRRAFALAPSSRASAVAGLEKDAQTIVESMKTEGLDSIIKICYLSQTYEALEAIDTTNAVKWRTGRRALWQARVDRKQGGTFAARQLAMTR